MRLLSDTLQESNPLLVVVLTGLIHQDEVNTAQGRRRGPSDLAICAFPLIAQYTVYRINLYVLDTVHLRELRLEGVYELSRGAYDKNVRPPFRGANGKLKQYRLLARSGTTRYVQAAPVPALLLLVVQR